MATRLTSWFGRSFFGTRHGQRKPAHRSQHHLRLEPLETRTLMSVSPTSLPMVWDAGFGASGTAAVVSQTGLPQAETAAQIDGKVIIANGNTVVRLNVDGTLDKTFGNGGTVVLSSLTDGGTLRDATLVVEADGKILIMGTGAGIKADSSNAGNSGPSYTYDDSPVIERLNSDGSLDTSFGAGGMVVTHFGQATSEGESGVSYGDGIGFLVESDGKILELGTTADPSGANLTALAMARYNANGTLDATFGNGGIVVVDSLHITMQGYYDTPTLGVSDARLQSDGKLLLAGEGQLGPVMVRLNADGTLDSTFGSGGEVFFDNFASDPNPQLAGPGEVEPLYRVGIGGFDNIALQADGKIVATAHVDPAIDNSFLVLARFNSDGTLDTSFGQNGTVAIPDAYAGNNYSAMLARSDGSIVLELSEELISYNADGSVNSSLADNADAYLLNMSQDACGRIVVAGYTGPAVNTGETSYSIVSMRCVDPGQVQVIDPIAPQPVVSAPQAPVQVVQPVQTFSDFAAHQSLSLLGTQADGKTVWRGQTAFSGDSSYEVLFRFNADGTLDTTFGTGGQVDLQLNNFTVIFASAAQPDGKLLLAGNFHSLAGLGPDDLMLVRLNSDGTLDTSFGVNGAVVDQNVVGKYMSLQADGGIAIVGKDFATNNALVTRLNADGTVDTTFGQKGKVTLEYSDQTSANLTRVPDGGSFTEDTLLLLPDGKILMGGNADIFVGGTSEVAAILERYNADGTLDTTFGNNGVVSQIWSGSGSMIEGLAVQSDGKILAVGQTTSGQGLLERFNADGTLDATFGNAGTVLVDAIPSLDDVVVLSDGTIVTGAMANNQTLVTRYRADGSLDTSFGTNGTLTVETGLADAWGRLQVLGDGTLAVFGETTADLEKAAAPFETRIVGSTQSTIILGTSTHDLEAVPPAPPQTTAGLYDPITSTFLLRNSNDSGIADQVVAFGPGGSGDIPLTGDWTGSGIQSVGLYDPATSTFYLRNSNSSGIADTTLTFGPAHSHLVPIVGDWDGNGTDTVGLYDPASSMFYLTNSNTTGMATVTFVYGAAHGSQTPLVGDWTASGKDTVGLYDPASSMFFLKNQNTSGFADTAFVYGAAHNGGTPVAGNWTGSGSSAVGLYNPTTSLFYLKNANSTGIADTVFSYGAANGGLTPVVGAWELHFSRTAGQGTGAGTATLTQSDLQPIVNEAIALWGQAGLDAGAVKKLRQVQFIIGDLSSNQLGETNGDVVQIDANAAGYGWFVDPTPTSNEEFSSPAGSSQLKAVDPQALDHIDLLTVVEHELGHVAGLGDLSGLASDIMNGVLGAGVRRLASATDAALVS